MATNKKIGEELSKYFGEELKNRSSLCYTVFLLSSVILFCYLGLRGSCGGLFVNGCNVFIWGIQFISPLGFRILNPFLLYIDRPLVPGTWVRSSNGIEDVRANQSSGTWYFGSCTEEQAHRQTRVIYAVLVVSDYLSTTAGSEVTLNVKAFYNSRYHLYIVLRVNHLDFF